MNFGPMRFADYRAKFKQWPGTNRAAAYESLLVVANKAKPIVEQATKDAPKASENGATGAVAFKRYLRRWRSIRLTSIGSMGVLVSNSSPYAMNIDYGRRSGSRPPPASAIARWAQLKLGLSAKEAKRVSFGIAKKIGERGLWGRGVLHGDSSTNNLVKPLHTTNQLIGLMETELTNGILRGVAKAFT